MYDCTEFTSFSFGYDYETSYQLDKTLTIHVLKSIIYVIQRGLYKK